jgi:hypothetical protein
LWSRIDDGEVDFKDSSEQLGSVVFSLFNVVAIFLTVVAIMVTTLRDNLDVVNVVMMLTLLKREAFDGARVNM